jgi:hypothetical protein
MGSATGALDRATIAAVGTLAERVEWSSGGLDGPRSVMLEFLAEVVEPWRRVLPDARPA